MGIDIQNIALLGMIAISTIFQLISILKGDVKTATKIEQQKEKAIKKLNKKEQKNIEKIKKIEEKKKEINNNANDTKG